MSITSRDVGLVSHHVIYVEYFAISFGTLLGVLVLRLLTVNVMSPQPTTMLHNVPCNLLRELVVRNLYSSVQRWWTTQMWT